MLDADVINDLDLREIEGCPSAATPGSLDDVKSKYYMLESIGLASAAGNTITVDNVEIMSLHNLSSSVNASGLLGMSYWKRFRGIRFDMRTYEIELHRTS